MIERHKLTFRVQGLVNGLAPELNRILAEAYEQAEAKVLKLMAQDTPSKVKQARILQGLQKQLQRIMDPAYQEVGQEIQGGAQDLAQATPKITGKIYTDALQQFDSSVLPLAIPKITKKEFLRMWESFEIDGTFFNQWLEKLSGGSVARIKKELIQGQALNENLKQIAKRMETSLGASKNGAYGLAQNAYFQAWNFAEQETFRENEERLKGYQHVSELDAKCCPTCQQLDGKVYPKGEEIVPPIHWRCRCMLRPVFKQKGMNVIYQDQTRIVRIEKGKELDVKFVSGKLTYTDILKSDKAFAVEALGQKRADLLFSGKLSVDKLYYQSKLRSIKELERYYK